MVQETGTETVAEKARANDAFRRATCDAAIAGDESLPDLSLTMLFEWVRCDDDAYFTEILKAVAAYDSFSSDTDPSGEHRTGVIERDDRSVAFAIHVGEKGNRSLVLGYLSELQEMGHI